VLDNPPPELDVSMPSSQSFPSDSSSDSPPVGSARNQSRPMVIRRRAVHLSRRLVLGFGAGVLATVVTVESGSSAFGQTGTRTPSKETTQTPTGAKGKSRPVSTKGEEPAKNADADVKPAAPKESADKSKDSSRWREGHSIENLTATFTISETERFMVNVNAEKGLIALENLSLERIADAMRIDSADNRWVVTGRITEFRGQNFLWIERATRAAKIAGQ
jgi:hypothetical protein